MSFLANPYALVIFVMIAAAISLSISNRSVTLESFFNGKNFYGLAGTLAYTFYYISFLTGGFIVSRIRQEGANSVQEWLGNYFGKIGHWTYNFLVVLRLLSEVFANLIVIGLIFSSAFPEFEISGQIAIFVVGIIGLLYSAKGGFQASLKTDVFQMNLMAFMIKGLDRVMY